MEGRGSGSFQHTQGKAFRVPHFEKTWFQQGLILHIDWNALDTRVIIGQFDEERKEYVYHLLIQKQQQC